MQRTQSQTEMGGLIGFKDISDHAHPFTTPALGSIYAFPGAKLTEPHPAKMRESINNKNSIIVFFIIIQNPADYLAREKNEYICTHHIAKRILLKEKYLLPITINAFFSYLALLFYFLIPSQQCV